jgi:AcrR family transcriptional regulator
MVRPATIRDEDLLRAAREAFLEHGVAATTADIAARAGVSEGILFHRYGSKAKLFQASMTQPEWRPVLEGLALEKRVGHGTVDKNIAEIVNTLISFYRQLMPWVMMRYSSRNEPGLHPMLEGANPPPVIFLRALAGYFEAEMQRGRIRSLDSEIAARTLVGGAMQLVFGEVLAAGGSGAPLPIPKDMFIRGFVDLLMHGLHGRSEAATGVARKKKP